MAVAAGTACSWHCGVCAYCTVCACHARLWGQRKKFKKQYEQAELASVLSSRSSKAKPKAKNSSKATARAASASKTKPSAKAKAKLKNKKAK